ncbi:hypothetical protein NSE01_08600 [Novosphingobium sediminis]|uniref:Uncharacterized protein n=1 Tax=Novosphingobium sediminis TaxID=707214 RepID=A0A512AH34_9SPHN|nr:prepilin-type N-terminal cleavage/methylation domain-containing protein [Novosphingobium sediminis]GEN99027.1 hypothetical protein NSE01_08600 [Novosphingobium sediminis]
MQPDPRERGFLMVEALVALAIAALMAALVFDTVWQMGRTATVAAEQRQALLLARSVLAAASVPGSGSPISPHGSDGHLSWSIASEPYADGATDGLALQTVHVQVRDAVTGRTLARLTSLKAQQ